MPGLPPAPPQACLNRPASGPAANHPPSAGDASARPLGGVDDLDAAEAVVKAAGLEPFNHADYEPGRRFYFFDWDGIEFEMVSYA